MNDDKSYTCSAAGCGQCFVSADHLAVHRHKHEMTLKFPPLRNDSVIVADQTPTPTRFLKSCEEVGLFNELDSPLEQDMKKLKDDEGKQHALDLRVTGTPDGSRTRLDREEARSRIYGRSSPRLSDKDKDPACAALPHSRPATLPLPRPGTLPLYFSGHSPGVVVQQAFPSPSSPSVITQAPSSNRHLTPLPGHVPLLFHLPNGQTMPLGTVTSPTMPIPTALPLPFSTIPSPVAMIPSPVGMIPHIPGIPGPHMFSALPSQLPSPPEPKMRLKMILSEHQDSRSAEEGSSQHEKAIKEERPQMEHRPWEKSPHDICMKDVRMPGQALGIGGSGLTRRRRCAIEDPEERRRRFLERNRAAATRCRLKRKAWVFSLEKKAEELTETNTQLQSEVTMLRREVAHLKQLLLAHKDCPVTAMQKKQAYGGCDEIGRNTAIATRLSSKPAALLGPLHEEPGPSEAMRAALLLSSHEMRASESRDVSLGKAGQSPVIIMPTKPLPVSQ